MTNLACAQTFMLTMFGLTVLSSLLYAFARPRGDPGDPSPPIRSGVRHGDHLTPLLRVAALATGKRDLVTYIPPGMSAEDARRALEKRGVRTSRWAMESDPGGEGTFTVPVDDPQRAKEVLVAYRRHDNTSRTGGLRLFWILVLLAIIGLIVYGLVASGGG